MDKTNTKYFILLKNIEESHESNAAILGSLWVEESHISPSTVLVSHYEGDEVGTLKQFELNILQEINHEVAQLLLAIPAPLSNRIKVIGDQVWINEGLAISVGSVVKLYNVPDLPNGASGVVRFKGQLPGINGTKFGIELSSEYRGQGTTDGIFRHKKLFSCEEDSGVFVSIFKIRLASLKVDDNLRPSARGQAEGGISFSDKPLELQNGPSNVQNNSVLQINERIVWMSDYGPEFGTVKWVGTLPYSHDDKIVVGVEFDNEVGTGTGKYKGHQLFYAKRNHASLIPIMGLLRASVYMSMMSEGQGEVDTPSSIEYNLQDFSIGNNSHGAENHAVKYDNMNDTKDGPDSLDRLVDQVHKMDGVYTSNKQFDSYNGARPKIHSISTTSVKSRIQVDSLLSDNTGANTVGFTDKNSEFSGTGLKLPSASMTGKVSRKDSGVSSTISQENTMKNQFQSNKNQFQIGDKAIINFGGYRTGVIRWIGKFSKSKNPDQLIAGMEMDEEDSHCYNEGSFQGESLFSCPPRRGFFCPISKCSHV